ncbi:MAG: efflux RND transporter periplasmic adaptor subunit [Candidatus Taylorbacteria bacterium]|nr:efflux RND transporter periplasmic adaptor subunit [Candidatus Taylorbacteria bacterium]
MLSFIKRKKVIIIIIAVAVIAVALGLKARGNGGYETTSAVRGDLVRTVELSGKVVPQDDADLAFEVTGSVARVYKRVGDRVAAGEVIAELDKAATNADLMKAQADLSAARAELAKLEGGADINAKIASSRKSIVQSILDAYTDADDAIYNKVDQFFEDPRTPNPEIIFSFDDYALRNRVNAARVSVGNTLAEWRARTADLSVTTYVEADLESAKASLREISLFLDDVARAVNAFKPSTSLTQTQIDKYRTDVAAARQNVNGASATLISGEESLTSDVSDVPVQVARVQAAEATVANYASRLAKMSLRSPISGIVSKQDAKAGEAVSANTVVASVISEGLKMEAYVPEVSVAGVVEGALAEVTLDAYGDDELFRAKVVHVDPRETVRDGVSTYKIDLVFSESDERIRPGMTTNIVIETMRKEGALLLPERAVTGGKGSKTVLVKDAEGNISEREIREGLTDTNGNIEILEGISEADTVVLNPKK